MGRRRDDDSGEYRPPARPKRVPVPVWVWVLLAGGVGVVVLVCGGGLVAMAVWGNSLPTPTEETYDANELLGAYQNAPAKMDAQLRGRRVVVTGRVSGFLGDCVLLGDRGIAVTCFMPHRDVVKLSKGQTVSVRGRVGLGNSGGVYLEDARLVSGSAAP